MYWNKIKSNAPEILLLGAAVFLQFFRLGMGEIQPWDESLYLIRAEACVKFGAWLDQTQYAVAGLYSSMHPPLAIWMMAAGRVIFGNGVFASRLVAALSALAAIFFFYKIVRRLFSRWTALFATISLASAQHFIWYAHHAQLDIPMFACIVGASYFAIRAYENSGSKNAIAAGVFLGCALLTKAVQAFYLLTFLLALPYIFNSEKRYKKVLVIFITAFIIAVPWYFYMFLRHSEFSRDYWELIRSMRTGTYSGTLIHEWATEWWYYLNQTIINFPLLILGVIAIFPLIRKWKRRDTIHARMSLVVFCWFSIVILVVSFFPTRMLHFWLFLLLPGSLLLAFFIEEFLYLPLNVRNNLFSIAILLPTLCWSASELLRKAVREHAIPDLHSEYVFIVSVIISSILIAFLLYTHTRLSLRVILLLIVSGFFISAGYYRWATREPESYADGVTPVAEILLRTPEIHSVIVYHDGSPHEDYLPQLNYYTQGWLLGWDTTKRGTTKTWNEIDSLIKLNDVPRSDAAIIYTSGQPYTEPTSQETKLLTSINEGLGKHYMKSLHSKKYQLFWEPK